MSFGLYSSVDQEYHKQSKQIRPLWATGIRSILYGRLDLAAWVAKVRAIDRPSNRGSTFFSNGLVLPAPIYIPGSSVNIKSRQKQRSTPLITNILFFVFFKTKEECAAGTQSTIDLDRWDEV